MTTKKQIIRFDAQDRIIAGIINAITLARDAGEHATAAVMEAEATRLCKRYGLTQVPGLPATYEKGETP